ncbi:MAG TPA: MBL fold metallo-hydrolase [Rhodoglobus sp.]|nr:MBL fold metallo-hydrolase [Rhodoglobus sp.]
MKVTKHEHACLVIEKNDEALVIDPGGFTSPLSDVHGVVAVVITHEHPDHWTPDQLQRILDANPGARILGPAGVAAAADGFEVQVVSDGDEVSVGGFALRFFGTQHNVIHSSLPLVDNTGVLVDGELFHPGDSYTVPPVPVGTLAAPIGAPWLKIGEAMDYVLTVQPKRAFPIHEATLSQIGKGMHAQRLTWATEQHGGAFTVLDPLQSIDL